MKYINFSEQESGLAKLRIGRTDVLYSFNAADMLKEIYDLQLDICRIKVDISNSEIFDLLDKIQLPTCNHSFLIEQIIDLDSIDENMDVTIDFEIYSIDKKTELLQLIKNIQANDTFNVYYKNDIIDKILPYHLLNDVIAEYQTTFDPEINKGKHCFLAYKDETLIGYCTLDTTKGIGDGILVGILPEYRSLDLFKNFVRKQINFTRENACKFYTCKTNAFNSRSLNTTLKQGMKISKVILNINILSLLNLPAQEKRCRFDNTIRLADLENIITDVTGDTILIEEYKSNIKSSGDTEVLIKIFTELGLVIIVDEANLQSAYLNYSTKAHV